MKEERVSLHCAFFLCRTLRTLASQPKGCLRLRDNNPVICALKVGCGKLNLSLVFVPFVQQCVTVCVYLCLYVVMHVLLSCMQAHLCAK